MVTTHLFCQLEKALLFGQQRMLKLKLCRERTQGTRVPARSPGSWSGWSRLCYECSRLLVAPSLHTAITYYEVHKIGHKTPTANMQVRCVTVSQPRQQYGRTLLVACAGLKRDIYATNILIVAEDTQCAGLYARSPFRN